MASSVPTRRAPRGPRKWTDERILEELRHFVGDQTAFPTRRQFEAAGQRNLWNAVRDRGGVTVWAPRVGLPLREAQRRRGLSEKEAVGQALQVVRTEGYLPGPTKLRRLGYPKLATFVHFAGGARRFCHKHGLPPLPPL